MRLQMKIELSLLEDAQLSPLLQDALRVLRQVPFRVQGTDEFFDHLSGYGCAVDGEFVRFPQAVIDRVLGRAAEEKARWLESQPVAADMSFGMHTHGQALHVCDLETNQLRPATEDDLAHWCHAVDALGDVRRTHPTFIPTDVPRSSSDFHTFGTILLNSRQPHRVSVYSAAMLPFFAQAQQIAQGALAEREPVFATKCWVTSPFKLTRENVEIAMGARRLLGRPIEFGQMPVAGASSPVTVAGSLVQNTAESLALCAMRLAIDDLCHGIVPTTTMMDMKVASHRQSGPDLMLHRLAGSQMHAYLFGGRPTTAVLGVSAQTVSPQSLHEKAWAAALNFSLGHRDLGLGCLAYSDVGSPVQLILDYEMGLHFRHLLREVSTDRDHVGLATILDVVPRGAFHLPTEHTARFFREETWLSGSIDHRAPLAWIEDPSDMIETARTKARELFASAQNQCPLSYGQRQEILSLIAEADAVARGAG